MVHIFKKTHRKRTCDSMQCNMRSVDWFTPVINEHHDKQGKLNADFRYGTRNVCEEKLPR
jgi:hypothetical protein